VLEVLDQVNRELGTTIAVITHNANIAGMADRGQSTPFSVGVVIAWVNTCQRISPHGCYSEEGYAFQLVLMWTLDRKLLRELWLRGDKLSLLS
jgi:hypothetical protein